MFSLNDFQQLYKFIILYYILLFTLHASNSKSWLCLHEGASSLFLIQPQILHRRWYWTLIKKNDLKFSMEKCSKMWMSKYNYKICCIISYTTRNSWFPDCIRNWLYNQEITVTRRSGHGHIYVCQNLHLQRWFMHLLISLWWLAFSRVESLSENISVNLSMPR